jgi:hypothetical protein
MEMSMIKKFKPTRGAICMACRAHDGDYQPDNPSRHPVRKIIGIEVQRVRGRGITHVWTFCEVCADKLADVLMEWGKPTTVEAALKSLDTFTPGGRKGGRR